ncbi:MAG: septum formation initiator family protein [Clostridia bacterium]|nr:septum formation initiator family protein [Clostridia bacterium]MBR6702875.1 septum formation initiator family protein [Clostridia bacterium]
MNNNPRNKKLIRAGLVCLCAAVLIIFAFAIGKRIRTRHEQENTISSMSQTVSEIEEQNSRIQETIDNGEDESYIEHVAREDYNYVKPEERVYYDSEN